MSDRNYAEITIEIEDVERDIDKLEEDLAVLSSKRQYLIYERNAVENNEEDFNES